MISDKLKDYIVQYYNTRVQYAYSMNFADDSKYELEFVYNGTDSWVGLCSYINKTIYLNAPYLKYFNIEGIHNIINHELAHWIERRDVHGELWQQAAIKMSADPTSHLNEKYNEFPFILMLGEEKLCKCFNKRPNISTMYIPGRMQETLGKLYYIDNPNVIDDILF